MSKRIALRNNIYKKNKSFWIYKKLKRKGFIAGKYEVCISEQDNKKLMLKEKVIPKVVQELDNKETNFEANYDDKEDLKELLNLSNKKQLTRPFFCRVPSMKMPIQLSFDNFSQAVFIVFLSTIPLLTG